MMQRLLIIGATSAIAEACARRFARRGDAFFLVGRDDERLRAISEDLKVRGAISAGTMVLDAQAVDRFPALLEAAMQSLGGLDGALIAHGTLSDQVACQLSVDLLRQEFDINALSVMAF